MRSRRSGVDNDEDSSRSWEERRSQTSIELKSCVQGSSPSFAIACSSDGANAFAHAWALMVWIRFLRLWWCLSHLCHHVVRVWL
ncbi:hypothetical protein U1Q18_048374 [Sarracenia purpurea var. burkii]